MTALRNKVEIFLVSVALTRGIREEFIEHVSMDTETSERGNTRPMGRVRGLSATNRPRI